MQAAGQTSEKQKNSSSWISCKITNNLITWQIEPAKTSFKNTLSATSKATETLRQLTAENQMLDRCLRIYKLLKIKFMQMSEVTSTAHFTILFWKLSHGTGDPLKHHRNGGTQYYESAVESPINLWSYNYSCAYTLFSNHRSAHTTPQYQLEENPSTMSKACLSGYPESLMFWQRIVVLGWQQIWPTDTIYN